MDIKGKGERKLVRLQSFVVICLSHKRGRRQGKALWEGSVG